MALDISLRKSRLTPVMKVWIGQRITCLRCGKEWHARKTEVKMCPSCKSLLFNVPKKPSVPAEALSTGG